MRPQPFKPVGACLVCLAATWLIGPNVGADSAEPTFAPDPPGLASFTRAIQPLLLNRCAAGACHGGPQAAEPRFTRGPARGRISRPTTLANLESLTAATQRAESHQKFLQTVLQNHRPESLPGRPAAGLLSSHERQLLATWLAAFSQPPPRELPDSEPASHTADQAVVPTAFARRAEPPAESPPNRFRALLEQATNPPQLPPPRVTKGLDLEKLLPEEFPPVPAVSPDQSEE